MKQAGDVIRAVAGFQSSVVRVWLHSLSMESRQRPSLIHYCCCCCS